jgi:hypothetical protein
MFPGRNYSKELEHLYARLAAINELIVAFREYRRVLRRTARQAAKSKTA